MRFSKVIGKCDPALVKQAEDKLSSAFTELSLSYDNKLGSGMGGDALIFQLMYPLPHICDATGIQLDDFKSKQDEIEKRIADGETVSKEEQDQVSDDLKKYRQHMNGRVLRTAATDGRRFYWAPDFVVNLSKLGLRLVIGHESWHALWLHPQRRGSRIPKLYNISVDFRVNYDQMRDLAARGFKEPAKTFTENLGEFITLDEYIAFLKNPFEPPPRLAHSNPIHNLKSMADPAYVHPGDNAPPMYYADEKLEGDMRKPEVIYDTLLKCIPRCPKCGKLGMYKKPEEYKKLQKQIEEQEKKKAEEEKAAKDKEGKGEESQKAGGKKQKGKKGQKQDKGQCSDPSHNHEHGNDGEPCEHEGEGQGEPQQGAGENPGQGQGQPQPGDGQGQQPGEAPGGSCCDGDGSEQGQEGQGSCCDNGCPECGGGDSEYVDPFGCGSLTDEHLDSDVSEDELAKRLYDAAEMAKRMGGRVPAGISDELDELISPKIRWEDLVRQMMTKKREGAGRNNWQKPKTRALLAGLYVPKKEDHYLNILCAYDCSGSMSSSDIALGISQLQVIDTRGEIWLLPWDATAYFSEMVKIKKADKESLIKAQVHGRGGTECSTVFNEYEKHCGKVDLIIMITDSFLSDTELTQAKRPPKETDTIWLVTSHNDSFKPPWGRVLNIRNE
jgi:predicted metal-dependent peptidase